MAFRAQHYECIKKHDLKPIEISQAFYSAIFVFFIQVFLIIFLGQIIFKWFPSANLNVPFDISLPDSIIVLGSRFLCTILMHLQVESDVRQGIKMMKYNTNHRF